MPILFGYGTDPKKGFVLSLGFALGRFAGYFLLGMVAAMLGATFIDFFNNTYPAVSSTVILVFGLITIFYGTVILAKAEIGVFGEKRCRSYLKRTQKLESPILGTIALGFVSTITPCVPVFTFLLLPFALGKVVDTAFLTVAFGLGANMAFIAIGVAMGFGVKNVRERFTVAKRPLEVLSAAILVLFGLFYVIWALGPQVFGWANSNYTLPTVYDFIAFVKYVLGEG
jgi:sulfite exporter TauE/SafE